MFKKLKHYFILELCKLCIRFVDGNGRDSQKHAERRTTLGRSSPDSQEGWVPDERGRKVVDVRRNF